MQIGDASNSARVLTKLASSRVMLVFLLDFVGVLSTPAGSGATREMKLKLWQLYYLCTNIPLIPNQNNCVGLAWNVCWLAKHLADATSYNQASVETKMNRELNNTSGGVRLVFHEHGLFRELEFYQCVAKCCNKYNHPPKFCLRFVLEPPYRPSSATCLALSSTSGLVVS